MTTPREQKGNRQLQPGQNPNEPQKAPSRKDREPGE
jgi:hypothetical protein